MQGPISGVLESDTYIVVDTIFVQPGDSLRIESGSALYFNEGYVFRIFGFLHAEGIEGDSIRFISAEEGFSWGGIDFDSTASNNSRLDYCIISGSNSSGVSCLHTTLTISHCLIMNNENELMRGGGIWALDHANLIIENCIVKNNFGILDGGGLYFMEQSLGQVSNCIISGNVSEYGGGVYCNNSQVIIRDCIILDNTATAYGGGIYLYATSSHVVRCLIYGNDSDETGGGIQIRSAAPTVINCTITGNHSVDGGSGIALDRIANASINNSIISGNENEGIRFENENDGTIGYCNIYGNDGQNLAGDIPEGLLTHLYENFNHDSCDVNYNISYDPNFIDPDNDDYYLLPESPCIDACDPYGPRDPDGTICDMGGYYFEQPPPSFVFQDTLISFGTIDAGDSSFSFLVVQNEGEGLGVIEHISVENSLESIIRIDALFPMWFRAGSIDSIEVSWHPEEIYTIDLPIYIYHNDSTSANPQIVRLTGNAQDEVAWTKESPLTVNCLAQNYPNPFNSNTFINFNLAKSSSVLLSINNLLGQDVSVLVDERLASGFHTYNLSDQLPASGIYFYTLRAGEFVERKRMYFIQ
ncbi:MAG: right-handed parallel beta-helix repeat-containing protein [Candidatus Electryonea clarkiae]|nr:right-handed parallel beta-helix repeat-containing protein [Candidatus Electryonea clarkiae]MDP8285983.1 right-handed parallel beta-helix repeat-containing protein [Candidatus Electryonea clarkiae]